MKRILLLVFLTSCLPYLSQPVQVTNTCGSPPEVIGYVLDVCLSAPETDEKCCVFKKLEDGMKCAVSLCQQVCQGEWKLETKQCQILEEEKVEEKKI